MVALDGGWDGLRKKGGGGWAWGLALVALDGG